MDNRRYHDFPLEFSVSQCRKTSWGPLFWFGNFGVPKNCMMNWGLSRFFHRKYSVSQYRKSLWGTPFLLRKFLLWKKLMDKRGGYHDFQSKLFSLTVPKNIVGEPFWVSKNLGFGKILCIIEGHHVFPSVFLVSQYRKMSWGNHFVFHKFLVWKKVMDEGGVGYHIFPSNILCLIVSENFLGDPCLFDKFSGIDRFFARRGWNVFIETILSLTVPKLS